MAGFLIDMVALAPGRRPQFDANNTQAFASMEANPTPFCYFSKGGLGEQDVWQRGDNILILRGGVVLPYQFVQANEPVIIDLSWVDTAEDLVSPITRITFPAEGEQFNFQGASDQTGIYAKHLALLYPDTVVNARLRAQLVVDPFAPSVSMFGAPDVLNGQTLECQVWLQIQHTLDLIGGV